MKIFFEMLYERPLIKREFASVSQLQEERSNIARSLWRAEWRQKQPCFYLFFDQRPRNYVIVVIRNVVSFTQLPHFRDENIQQTNRTRDDDIIIRIFETYWHYFLLSERLFMIKDRYLFFFETNRWRIQWNRAHSLSVWKSIFRITRGYFVMKSRKTSFFFASSLVKLVWIVCHDTAKIRDLRFPCGEYLQFNMWSNAFKFRVIMRRLK